MNKSKNGISYAEYGHKTGFPILIQHGLIASIKGASIFGRLIDLGARLICIARPGYGESSPIEMKNIGAWGDLVSALVDELELSHFDVLGMSSGATYSYAIGHKLPDKARNLYIFSGIPAMYDDEVLSFWPYPVNKNASITEMEKLAHELFFSNLSAEALSNLDIQDSMRNNAFGLAQDFKLRCMDWGFTLSDLKTNVLMQHSRFDPEVPFKTAQLTAKLIPRCELIVKESDVHFSEPVLDEFIQNTIAPYFEKRD